MTQITIYTTPTCGYCQRAKMLLDRKKAAFTEIDVAADPDARVEMTQKSDGGRTVPQIFIRDLHVGGCDDLYALERAGKLDPLLSA